ncbi:MAG: hypothetical protein GWO24_33840, partial [Akkermansiaceae bacterium]|nr:hypothetical protein [Akkermansiaceae bacterium]
MQARLHFPQQARLPLLAGRVHDQGRRLLHHQPVRRLVHHPDVGAHRDHFVHSLLRTLPRPLRSTTREVHHHPVFPSLPRRPTHHLPRAPQPLLSRHADQHGTHAGRARDPRRNLPPHRGEGQPHHQARSRGAWLQVPPHRLGGQTLHRRRRREGRKSRARHHPGLGIRAGPHRGARPLRPHRHGRRQRPHRDGRQRAAHRRRLL